MRSPSQHIACDAFYGCRLKDASRNQVNVSAVTVIKRSDEAAMLCGYDFAVVQVFRGFVQLAGRATV